MTMVKNFQYLIAKIKSHSLSNWSYPFLSGSMLLLAVSAISLSVSFWQFAEALGACAYFVLVVGVALQLLTFFTKKGDIRNGSS
jgi:hypothetical protein